MRYRYTISTQWFPTLAGLVGKYFDGFRISQSVGYWKGKPEDSAQIIIVGEPSIGKKVERLMQEIRKEFKQEATLIEVELLIVSELQYNENPR